MSIEIKVPALGESVSEAAIAKLYKNKVIMSRLMN